MTVQLENQTYYRTQEVCRLVGIHKSTLMRWLKSGAITTSERRDRRGWRLFSSSDIQCIRREATRMTVETGKGGSGRGRSR